MEVQLACVATITEVDMSLDESEKCPVGNNMHSRPYLRGIHEGVPKARTPMTEVR
jgi:hypothetical protein